MTNKERIRLTKCCNDITKAMTITRNDCKIFASTLVKWIKPVTLENDPTWD
jgi:hypothetical protein